MSLCERTNSEWHLNWKKIKKILFETGFCHRHQNMDETKIVIKNKVDNDIKYIRILYFSRKKKYW